jgi:two-component system, NtrC family, sensor histidine kinase HydH
MKSRTQKRRFWINVPPWIIVGAVMILAPIFIFMTLESISRQKANTTKVLLEKGASLIRSFEAGARTGMMGMRWGGGQIQRLLDETAQQPDISYLIVTDVHGTILADSHADRIGKAHGIDLNLEEISRSTEIRWRRISEAEGEEVFEVFRRFAPTRGQGQRFRGRGMGMSDDWSRYHLNPDDPHGQIIFVGLDMGPLESARKEDLHRTMVMGLILLLVGFAGIVSLFLAQAYRATRSSLSRVQAFSDNLVEKMPVGLLAVDREGRVISFNQTAENLLGKSSSEVMGENGEGSLPSPLWNLVDRVRRADRPVLEELECPVGSGEPLPLSVSATRLKENDGTLLGYLLLLRDLREIRALEREVKRNERLASLGRLAAGVAHEIRNPLSSIKGFATYFKERYRGVPEDQRTAEIMIQEVERLNRAITQLLEFARPIHIRRESTNMDVLIDRSLDMVRSQAEVQGVRLEKSIEQGIGEIEIDQDRMNQVLLNLYLNAMQAMGEGGTLTVGLASREKGGKVGLTVADTGCGIEEKDLSHIFDPYYTTKPGGTGLGLPIVYNIVEAHRGEIQVESRPGGGTVITVLLPISDRS